MWITLGGDTSTVCNGTYSNKRDKIVSHFTNFEGGCSTKLVSIWGLANSRGKIIEFYEHFIN